MRDQTSLAAIRAASVWPLVFTSLAITGSPGPATISLTAAAAAAAATGVTAVLLAVPAIRSALIAVAAAYLLWLAYKVATPPGCWSGRRWRRCSGISGDLGSSTSVSPRRWSPPRRSP